MDITINASFLPQDDPDAAIAFYRDTLGFEVRNDVGYGGLHWITVGPPGQPGTSIVLYPPGADPGITEDERRTITEMMAKGTYGIITLATKDLDALFATVQASRGRGRAGADRAALRRSRLRLPRSRRQPDPNQPGGLRRKQHRRISPVSRISRMDGRCGR